MKKGALRTPEHKGKCESDVKYVKSNALAGHTFTELPAENLHLSNWERTVADVRIHGTTRKQVAALFAQLSRFRERRLGRRILTQQVPGIPKIDQDPRQGRFVTLGSPDRLCLA